MFQMLGKRGSRDIQSRRTQDHCVTQSSGSSQILGGAAALSRMRTKLLDKHDHHLDLVTDIEVRLDIEPNQRWTCHHPRCVETVQWMGMRDYHAALNDLEHLVVQQLCELTKLNMSGTCESFPACNISVF